MDPLHSVPVPTHGVLVGIDAHNSWPTGDPATPVRLTYIATNSTERLAFVSLQSSGPVARLSTRPANFGDMPYGLVIELYLTRDLGEHEVIHLAVAQSGATTYFPPQQIDDRDDPAARSS